MNPPDTIASHNDFGDVPDPRPELPLTKAQKREAKRQAHKASKPKRIKPGAPPRIPVTQKTLTAEFCAELVLENVATTKPEDKAKMAGVIEKLLDHPELLRPEIVVQLQKNLISLQHDAAT